LTEWAAKARTVIQWPLFSITDLDLQVIFKWQIARKRLFWLMKSMRKPAGSMLARRLPQR
jgi:hypothetical protein